MTLPIDQTALNAAAANQVPSMRLASALNIAAIRTATQGIDELYNYTNGLISAGTLSRLGIANATDYGAGSSRTATTGSITTGTKLLTVASTTSYAAGQGISIAGAGAAGAALLTSITSISGLVITLAANASTTVTGASLTHEDTAAIQAAMNAIYTANAGGIVVIPFNCIYTEANLTYKANVSLWDMSDGQFFRWLMNGHNVSGAVNEFIVQSRYHASIVLLTSTDEVTDALGAGQVLGGRASFMIQTKTAGVVSDRWQIANDINNDGTNGLTFYKLNSSRQMMYLSPGGSVVLGRLDSVQDFTEPEYQNTMRGSAAIERDDTQTILLVMQTKTKLRRKVIELGTDDFLRITNTLNTEYLLSLNNYGSLEAKRGVGGGAYTTGSRPAEIDVIGASIFDTTLGKPVWLKTGVKEYATLAIATGATTSGNLNIVLSGATVNVAVLAGDTAAQVATKVRAAIFATWDVGGVIGSTTVTFTAKTCGIKADGSFTQSNGITGTFTTVTQGVAQIWVDAAGTTV